MSDYDMASAAIACIPYENREQWLGIGMGLKSSLGEAGFELFSRFTEGASDNRRKEIKSAWKSFKGSRVTLGTVIHQAKQYGFEPGKTLISRSSYEQIQAVRREQRLRAIRERQAAAEAQKLAALEASERWGLAVRFGQSKYLERKKITPEAVRFEPASGAVLVPMIRYDRPREKALVGLQTLHHQGSKYFIEGQEKIGSACRLGPAVVDLGVPILIAEGYATARSLRMALDPRWPVFVAFDAGNLLPVGRTVRALYPKHWLLFAADDDFQTLGNPGRTKALMAARRVKNADVTCPVFESRDGQKLTDFNDLHCHAGLPEVCLQILKGVESAKRYSRRRIAA